MVHQSRTLRPEDDGHLLDTVWRRHCAAVLQSGVSRRPPNRRLYPPQPVADGLRSTARLSHLVRRYPLLLWGVRFARLPASQMAVEAAARGGFSDAGHEYR